MPWRRWFGRRVLRAAAPVWNYGRGALDSLSLALGVVTVMLHVLGERFELGFPEQLAERAISIPTGGEVQTIVCAQVLYLRGGVLVLDLSAFLPSTAVESRIFGSVTHTDSFLSDEQWSEVCGGLESQRTVGHGV